MRACLVVIHRRWLVSVTTGMVPLLWLGIMLVALSAGSPVVAHEPEGFVVPHGHAPCFSGPIVDEANIAEILATRAQIEQPMHFELIINPKTAQTLGLRLPPMLLIQADHGDSDRDNRCARVW